MVEENLSYVESMFGKDSIEAAEELLKLTDFCKILRFRHEK